MTGCQFLPVMKKDFEDELGCLAPIKTGEKNKVGYTQTHTIYH